MGLDHGSKRIGVAVGDTETRMAFERPAIRRRGLNRDLAVVGDLCRAEGATRVVIGLPLNMDASEGPQAAAARAFGEAVRGIGVEVEYEDERLTSWAARRHVGESGRRPERASGQVDSTAARLILQQYLDRDRDDPLRPEETE